MRNRGVRTMWGAMAAICLVACGSGGESTVSTSTAETSTTPESPFTSAPPATAQPQAGEGRPLTESARKR